MSRDRGRYANLRFCVAFACAYLYWGSFLYGGPTFTISLVGESNNNRLWQATIAPDVNLFRQKPAGRGGALAMEMGIVVSGSRILSATPNRLAWPFENPGYNPFIGAVGEGVQIMQDGLKMFLSLGSEFISSDKVEVITFATEGGGATTVKWGGQVSFPGTPVQFTGGRISQAGMNFDGLSGIRSAMSTFDCNSDGLVNIADANCVAASDLDSLLASMTPVSLRGDMDGNGAVLFSDFLTLSANFGSMGQYTEGDLDKNGKVEFADFLILSTNFGQSGASRFAQVPEPRSSLAGLLGSVVFCMSILRRNSVSSGSP